MMSLDRPAFHVLFQTERDRTFRFLLRLTRNRADAEDLLQESFLTVWRKREQFEGRGSAGGFLRRTAYHLYLNRRTRDERRAALAPRNGTPVAEPPADLRVERREAVEFLVERVREALTHLPAPAREVFVLFRFEGLTCSEIAELTDAPVKTVETRLLRATRALAARLETHRDQMP
jgi:RNA polymerase sigma-70 factor (ECF subfamily)